MRAARVCPSSSCMGDKRLAFVLAEVIYRTDVGMVEGGGRACLTLEALQSLRIFGQCFGEEFESYVPPQAQVLSLVNHTHPSTAQFADYVVMRNGLRNDGRNSPRGRQRTVGRFREVSQEKQSQLSRRRLLACLVGAGPRRSQRRLLQRRRVPSLASR